MACRSRRLSIFLLALILMGLLAGCNLGSAPAPEQEDITSEPTSTPRQIATRTPVRNITTPTLTRVSFPTQTPRPTSVAFVPPAFTLVPTNTSLPISIVILSPVPGSVVAGNVQVLGSAIHPQFLQYRLEFGPDPNPGNLWFPITGIVQAPILNGSLGIWNTNTPASPDGIYQLRLRVFLRDGRQQSTVVNGIRVRNQEPTPIPTNTPPIPRPIAAFTQDITQGQAPLVVRFINQSQGQITSYSWDFSDTGNSSVPNPVHTFSQPGIYTVTLRVSGPGGTANVSRQITVTSANAPVAAFEPSVSSGERPLQVTFVNQSSGNITGVSWNFGDGATSTQTSPTHTFTEVGTYNVILEVSGPGGTTTTVRQITVENPQIPPPTASFAPNPAEGEVPLTVSFSNETSGQATQYLWDFNGDGITDSNEFEPTFAYPTAGVYTARLTAIGPGGQSSAQAQITVNEPPDAPRANFTASTTSGDAPLRVEFTNTTTGNATSFTWDFESDGRIDTNAENPIHTYQTPGTYNASLTATGEGGSTTATQQITVTQPLAPPTADFEANPTIGEAPLNVQFTNTSEGDQLTLSWDFDGNGTVDSTTSNPSFEYTDSGNYTATLNVSNPAGSDSASVTINVSEAIAQLPPTAAFQPSVLSGFAPLNVQFTNQSFGDITNYEWDFDGNGTIDSTAQNPSHTYTQAGTYQAELTAIGPGGSNSITTSIEVAELPVLPVAQFATNTTSGTAPLNVTFSITTQTNYDAFTWDFDGDGTPDNTTDNPASFTYQQAGEYDATLTLSNAAGSDSTTQRITVEPDIAVPIADFSVQPTSGAAPLAVTFTITAQSQYDSFAWDFDGDGTTDNAIDSSPTFTYQTAGTYTPTLTLTNAAGSNSASRTLTVNEAAVAPVASFSAQPNSGETPLTVTFTITSQVAYDTFAWDFDGDGTADDTSNTQATFTYQTAGTYNPTLTLTNDALSDTATQTITVSQAPVAPIADFNVQPTEGDAPLTVTFTITSQSQFTDFAWDFNGDGTPDNTSDNPASFTYQAAGTYNPTLTLNNDGLTDTSARAVTVNQAVAAPIADFSVQPAEGDAPLTATFTITSQSQFTDFAWDFNGDGTPDNTSDNPASFTYQAAGTYNPTLTLNNQGLTDTSAQAVTVNQATIAPIADFSVQPTEGNTPLQVTFVVTSQSQYTNLAWDFNGDGTPDNTSDNPASFTYQTPGTYNPTLTLTNNGVSDTISRVVTVNAATVAPVAEFSAQPTDGQAPLTVEFAVTSAPDYTSLSWDFDGDGTPDNTTDAQTSFTYQTAGNYNATLTLSNNAGSDTTFRAIIVTAAAQPPAASFTAQPTSGNAPLTVTFNDTSTGTVDSRQWDFDGDGAPDDTSNTQTTFTYQQPGTYNVALTVTGAGTQDTATQQITVNQAQQVVIGPIAYVSDAAGDNDIFTTDAQGSNNGNLTDNPAQDIHPAWSPSGATLAFVSDREGDNDIYLLETRRRTSLAIISDSSNDQQPAWSPDEQRIAFVSDRNGSNGIFIADANGGNIMPLVDDGNDNQHPVWSPDGSQIAFTSNASGTRQVYTIVVNGDGSTSQLTTSSGNNSQPDWSPDGQRIVFTSDRNGNNDIFSVSIGGDDERQLTAAQANDSQPDWSPDGQRIVFTSDRNGNADLFTMGADGSTVTPLIQQDGNQSNASWR